MYFDKQYGGERRELGWTGLGYGQVAVSGECGNEPSGSTKCGEFLY